MTWQLFENSNLLEKFMQAFHQLHAPILHQMKNEKAWFDHYWLQQLNLTDCFLLEDADGPSAIVTYPKLSDIHYLRYQTPTLAVRPGFLIPYLPRPVENKSRCFSIPMNDGPNNEIRITNMNVTIAQYCTALNISNKSFESPPLSGLAHKMVQSSSEAQSAISIFRSRISEFGVEDYFVKYYLPLLCKEIAKIPLEGNAWCALSEDTTTGLPVAAALYSGWELPLGGPRAALVDDIVVLPEYRGRNIATDLQKFAYSALQKQEVKWVCGNIEKDNPASIRQSEKLGRRPWSAVIECRHSS